MKRITLNNLSIRNFKGCERFDLATSGNNVRIYGDNATGKTTVADAYAWLLVDKDSTGRSQFGVKTLDSENNEIHNLRHEVTVELDDTTFHRAYFETYQNLRKEATATFTGHTSEYKVNGVPVPLGQFTGQVGELISPELFKLLSNPAYFPSLKWDAQRALLIKEFGGITDADVYASNKALEGLPAILGRHSIEDYTKILAEKAKTTKKEIDGIPLRIDEVKRSLETLATGDVAKAEAEIRHIEGLAESLAARKSGISTGGEISELNLRISEAQGNIQELKNEILASSGGERAKLTKALTEAKGEREALIQTVEHHNRAVQRYESELGNLNRTRAALIELWKAIDARVLALPADDVCASCGQPLPIEQVQASRDKALAAFNAARASDKEANVATGKATKVAIEQVEQCIAESKARIETAQNQIVEANQKVDDLQFQLELTATEADPETDPRIIAIREEIAAMNQKIAAINSGAQKLLSELEEERTANNEKIAAQRKIIAAVQARQTAEKRIKDLGDEQKNLAKEIERIAAEQNLIEQFTRARIALLESSIADHFDDGIAFKLFRQQVNGGVAETCETTFKGVPYSDLNTGSKINVGLAIIDTFAAKFGIAPPIIIDNSESITEIRPTTGQQIQLIVSAADKELRVELLPTRELALA